MQSDWDECKVSSLVQAGTLFVEDGNHGEYRPLAHEFQPTGVPFVRPDNLKHGTVNFSECDFINDDAVRRVRKGHGRAGDVLFTHRATVGRLAYVGADAPPFVANPGVTIWRSQIPELLNQRFLYYMMQTKHFMSQVWAVAGSTDTFPYVSLTNQRNLWLSLPSAKLQAQIAGTLGVLDDKIDLNRRTNETLEAMARAIFNDWFVDFGPTCAKMERRAPYLSPEIWALFPDRLDDEGKPSGWYRCPLDQIARFLNGLALQKYPALGGSYLPVIKIAELRAGAAGDGDKASADVPANYVVDDGDILFSWSGSLLHRMWSGGRGALNQHLFKVTSQHYPKWFFFFWIGQHMDQFRAIAASKATTMGHIQRHHLAEAATIVADDPVMRAADATIAPLFAQILSNDLEVRTLAATRDLLLPKLMSGELRVREAERMVEAAL